MSDVPGPIVNEPVLLDRMHGSHEMTVVNCNLNCNLMESLKWIVWKSSEDGREADTLSFMDNAEHLAAWILT